MSTVSTVCAAAIMLSALLAGCAATQTAQFVTTANVDLRNGEDDEAGVIAMLPQGTPVVPVGGVGGECDCWKVETPAGTGWLYTRFIAMR